MTASDLHRFDLDDLEAVAVRAITDAYGDPSDSARFWIQKGIEGMRFAVAQAMQDGEGC